MCDKALIYVRKKNINEGDIKYIHSLLEKAGFYFNSFSIIETEKSCIEEQKKFDSMSEEEKQKKLKIEELVQKEINKIREIGGKVFGDEDDELTEDDKNTAVMCINGYKKNCLCALKDENLIIEILRNCIEHFDEVYYDPNCFIYLGSLKVECDNVVSLSRDMGKNYFMPSMSFKPTMKIIK